MEGGKPDFGGVIGLKLPALKNTGSQLYVGEEVTDKLKAGTGILNSGCQSHDLSKSQFQFST